MDGDFQKVKAQKLRDLQKLLILYLGRFLWPGGGDCSSGLKPVRGGEPWGALPLPFWEREIWRKEMKNLATKITLCSKSHFLEAKKKLKEVMQWFHLAVKEWWVWVDFFYDNLNLWGQGWTTRCILASGMEGNGKRMRKWRGKERKWGNSSGSDLLRGSFASCAGLN